MTPKKYLLPVLGHTIRHCASAQVVQPASALAALDSSKACWNGGGRARWERIEEGEDWAHKGCRDISSICHQLLTACMS